MNFSLTEDQAMIRDAAESFLADASDSAAVRAASESATGYDADLWQRIAAEMGWCATSIPETHGGLGLGPVPLVMIFEQMGRRLLCAPFFSTVGLAANLLQQVGSEAAQSRFLPPIAAGKLRVSVPMPSEGWPSRLRATGGGSGWVLDGVIPQVPDAASADWLLVFAQTPHGDTALFTVPREARGVTVLPLKTWDATRRFAEVELKSVSIAASERLDDPARFAQGLERAQALARLYLAAEQLGGAQQCLDLTVAYTATRKQFGRTIAGFQAVKHRCAQMMVQVEALRSAVYGAAAVEMEPQADVATVAMECAMARALAADTFFFCAQEAIQLHGGVGFTWEYDPQLYFKRAQAGSHWLGSADDLRAQIAARLLRA